METDPPRMKKRKARGTRGNVYVVTSAGAQYVEDNLDAVDEISLNGNDPANELQNLGVSASLRR